MFDRIAEPTAVTEIVGGRYDGDFQVEASCPGCGNPVAHILDAGGLSSHRAADCGNGCEGGYDVVRPMTGLTGQPHPWWKPALTPFGSAMVGRGLIVFILGGGEVA